MGEVGPRQRIAAALRAIGVYLWAHPGLLALYVAAFALMALWSAGVMGIWATTAVTVLGTALIAVSGIGPGDDRDKRVMAFVGTLMVGLATGIDALEKLHAAELRGNLEKDVLAFSTTDRIKPDFVGFLNSQLSACLNGTIVDVDRCDGLLALLERVDRGNGGVPYFRAEILRNRGRLSDSRDQFFRYLAEHRARRERGEDVGKSAACDRNAGFCQERMAWACHSIANDLFRDACAATDVGQRRDLFGRAHEQLVCEQQEFPKGFVQRLRTRPLPTRELETALDRQLKDPARPCSDR
jgi:hypothetical protein